MEEILEAGPGEIFAIFGVECATGDTLCEGDMSYPVIKYFLLTILIFYFRLDAAVCMFLLQ